MNKKQFYEHLELILSLIRKAEEISRVEPVTKTYEELERITDQFMSRFFELYLALRSDPSLKLNSKYQDFIEQSQYLLKGLSFELNHYVSELEDRLKTTFYYNEWEKIICKGRSAVEAVKEMYRGTSFEEFYEGENPDALILDTEDLDDSLEIQGHKKGYLKEEKIPREIPTSHWWWWSPNEPPNNRE